MTDEITTEGTTTDEIVNDEALRGAVVVGAVPGQSPRVFASAARAAALLGKPLVVAHVDTSRSVLPDTIEGYSQATQQEIAAFGQADLDAVRREARAHLSGGDVPWKLYQLIGDPAFAITHFANSIDAELIVVGTRGHGIGEAVRELVAGSVGARLSHLQDRPLLVVPQEKPGGGTGRDA